MYVRACLCECVSSTCMWKFSFSGCCPFISVCFIIWERTPCQPELTKEARLVGQRAPRDPPVFTSPALESRVCIATPSSLKCRPWPLNSGQVFMLSRLALHCQQSQSQALDILRQDLPVQLKLTLISWSSCLSLQRAGIKGMYHLTQLKYVYST